MSTLRRMITIDRDRRSGGMVYASTLQVNARINTFQVERYEREEYCPSEFSSQPSLCSY